MSQHPCKHDQIEVYEDVLAHVQLPNLSWIASIVNSHEIVAPKHFQGDGAFPVCTGP